MVALTFIPTTEWTHFDAGRIQIVSRYQKIFFNEGGTNRFTRGRVVVRQNPIVRIATFAPFISFSQSKIAPDERVRPFNLLRGRASVRAGASRRVIVSGVSTNAFQRLNGVVYVRRESAAFGTLSEFGTWVTTWADPTLVYLTNLVNTTDTGGPGTAWKRISGVVVPPKKARYMGLGAKFIANSGDLTVMRPQYLKYAQVERLGVGEDVTAYSAPREVRTTVRPDRLNWSPNPGLAVNTTNWGGVTRVADAASPTGWAGRVTTTNVVNANFGFSHTIPIVYPDAEYTLSMMVWADRTVAFSCFIANGTILEQRVPKEIGSIPQRLWIRFKTDSAGTAPQFNGFYISRGVVANCYSSAAMVEKDGRFDAEYFDGSTYGTDSIWENGATAGAARSYYYKNRTERLAALKRLLKENVPFGLPIAEPRMGLLPADIAPVGTSNLIYGSGVYGGGLFGGS